MGTVTGILERPSRNTPETRKADRASRSHVIAALLSLHAAEHAVMTARHRDATSAALQSLYAQCVSHLAGELAAIAATTRAKMAAILLLRDPSARAAALQRLKEDERMEVTVARRKAADRRRSAHAALMGALRPQQRAERQDLQRAHRAQWRQLSSWRVNTASRLPAVR